MPPNLDQYLDEMFDVEVDLIDLYNLANGGAIIENEVRRAAKLTTSDDEVIEKWEARTYLMMLLAYDIETAQVSYRKRLRELNIPTVLEQAQSDEDENVFTGVEFCRKMLETGDKDFAVAIGTEPSTPEELDKMAAEMERSWKWIWSEAEEWVAFICNDVAEQIYRLARTKRSDILAALDARFGPETEEGWNEIQLSAYLLDQFLDD